MGVEQNPRVSQFDLSCSNGFCGGFVLQIRSFLDSRRHSRELAAGLKTSAVLRNNKTQLRFEGAIHQLLFHTSNSNTCEILQ